MTQASDSKDIGGYRFLPDQSHADIAFEATAQSPSELFRYCALATYDIMVDRSTVKRIDKHSIESESDDLADLLFQFLGDIVYLKDAQEVLANDVRVELQGGLDWTLQAVLIGEMIDHSRHSLGQDVKAVTYHNLTAEQQGDLWVAHVVLDI